MKWLPLLCPVVLCCLPGVTRADVWDSPPRVIFSYQARPICNDGRNDCPNIERTEQAMADLGATAFFLRFHTGGQYDYLTWFLEESARTDIKVWAITRRRCPAEPFAYDCVAWAQRLAELSLEYPNLEAFVLDDLHPSRFDDVTPDSVRSIIAAKDAINPELKFIPTLYIGPSHETVFFEEGNAYDGVFSDGTSMWYWPSFGGRFTPTLEELQRDVDEANSVVHPIPFYVGIYPLAGGSLREIGEPEAQFHDPDLLRAMLDIAVNQSDGVGVFNMPLYMYDVDQLLSATIFQQQPCDAPAFQHKLTTSDRSIYASWYQAIRTEVPIAHPGQTVRVQLDIKDTVPNTFDCTYNFEQLLVDGEVVWESDVCADNRERVSVDQRVEVSGPTAEVIIRLYAKKPNHMRVSAYVANPTVLVDGARIATAWTFDSNLTTLPQLIETYEIIKQAFHSLDRCRPGEPGCQLDCGDLTECDGACVDLEADPAHCGACGAVCPDAANATAVCEEGRCGQRCVAGHADCNGDPQDGCEAALGVAAECPADDGPPPDDGGPPPQDSGPPPQDSGPPPQDSGPPSQDGGIPPARLGWSCHSSSGSPSAILALLLLAGVGIRTRRWRAKQGATTGSSLLLSLPLLLSALATTSSAQNLVPDPSFETGQAHWDLLDGLSSIDNSVARSGSRSLKLRNDGAARGHNAGQFNIGGAQAGVEYEYSVWVRGTSVAGVGSGGKPMSVLQWRNSSGAKIGKEMYMWAPYDTYGWQPLGIVLQAPPHAAAIDVSFRSWYDCLSGFTQWDDASLTVRNLSYRGSLTGSYQAGDASSRQGGAMKTEEPNHTGSGYFQPTTAGAFVEWSDIPGGVGGGSRILSFRYTMEGNVKRWEVLVNGASQGIVKPIATGRMSSWASFDWPVTLQAGQNRVRVRFEQVTPKGPLLDRLDVFRAGGVVDDAGPPDTAQPDAVMPDTAQPDAAMPDTAQPDAAMPDTAQPDAGPPGPFGGTPWAIPGAIEAEDYDEGGEGIGYHDRSAGNGGGLYRTDDVDIWSTQEQGTLYYTGANSTNEWLAYTVEVAATARYAIALRVATPNDGRVMHLEQDGIDVTGPIEIPNTDGWTQWQWATTTVWLEQGERSLKVDFDVGGLNFDAIDIARLDSPPDAGPPDSTLPDTEEPDTAMPDIDSPDTDEPDIDAPDAGAPDTEEPDASAPDTEEPDADAPDIDAPDADAPDADAPDAERPETDASRARGDTYRVEVGYDGPNPFGCAAAPWSGDWIGAALLALLISRRRRRRRRCPKDILTFAW